MESGVEEEGRDGKAEGDKKCQLYPGGSERQLFESRSLMSELNGICSGVCSAFSLPLLPGFSITAHNSRSALPDSSFGEATLVLAAIFRLSVMVKSSSRSPLSSRRKVDSIPNTKNAFVEEAGW